MLRTIVSLVLLLFFATVASAPARAAGSERSSKSPKPAASYDEGMKLVEAGDFEKARTAFEQAVRRQPRDPDALNMLAYSQRKTGQLDRAIGTYKKALKIRPRFPQAREYLAEAYLQASLRELETLKGYGKQAEAEHAQLVKALQGALRDLPQAEPGARGAPSEKAGW